MERTGLHPDLLQIICDYLEGSRVSFSLVSKEMSFTGMDKIYLDSGAFRALGEKRNLFAKGVLETDFHVAHE
jgi:hypothetical protein